ncbi:MAG TPA: fumarylacetoacetate hydrolase family protein [Chthoniobacteraceae bacterium]|jgi:2-dehydro-3-deoxy-D-arabinonate dehydratase|nr:fumarylacetoacetate hydrolase family protein [Chthoniobacteraceae bacterium]
MAIPPITVFREARGVVAQRGENLFLLSDVTLDALFQQDDPVAWLYPKLPHGRPVAAPDAWLAPIDTQEVWAAGVTYLRSREARKDESKEAGGGTFYERVYDADRPEIFFKATPHRVVGHGGKVRIRSDSHWNVPEPEVALAINRAGRIFGYTIGNDMSSRDIEGENPLYLPQAKVYSACCGLGPGIVVREPLPRESKIRITIERAGTAVFTGTTAIDQMKRGFEELAEFLYRDNDFPNGSFLLTGTGVVPGNDFTLASGDAIRIKIDGIGTLLNIVA